MNLTLNTPDPLTLDLGSPQPAEPSLEKLVDEIVAHGEASVLEEDLAAWRADLHRRLEQLRQHPEQGLGFIEEHVRQACLQLQCLLVQQAMQEKADALDENCPDCHRPLREKKRRVVRWIQAYCGPVKLVRTHGWCPHCRQWVFPADRALGLRSGSSASPLVQEMCALLVTKMPAEHAETIALRVTGRSLSRSTLAREAQRQGERAQTVRQRLVETPPHLPAHTKAQPPPTPQMPSAPFTLVIEIDAWHIRERDHWGQTRPRRQRGEDVERWHWVYTGTCFRLTQRCLKPKGTAKTKWRPLITERSFVATRGGIQPLMEQLCYEARARGLCQAERVLVVADGALWIWKAAQDRFQEAVQRLDLYHADTYLWAVANARFGKDPAQARRWVKPLLRQLRKDQAVQVITQLEELQPQLTRAAAKAADEAVEYYRKNLDRMKYQEGRRRHEPVGSGAIESTCRQLQCRMKRCGQFWSTHGDEALLCLETFWRNERWELLFPHAKLTSVSNN